MQLSVEKLKKELKDNRKASVLTQAKSHQDRIKFHAETHVSSYMSGPLDDFLAFTGSLIPKDKFKIFKQMLRFPLKTNELVSVVFEKLSRVFDGRNPSSNYQFKSTEDRDDWEWYRQEVLHEPGIWKTEGWEHMKTEINSVLIVDLATEQDPKDKRPAPYFYWLPIERVVNFEADPRSGQMLWIAFRVGKDSLAVMDGYSYRLFDFKDNQLVFDTPKLENVHTLGYCPARFFWDIPLSLNNPDVKESPISKELENLDWYLFYAISKRNLDLYGSYPIYSGYAANCDYVNDQTGDYCDGGFLRDAEHHWRYDANGLVPCPKCKDKRLSGAGSYIEVPIPEEGQPDLRDPVSITTVDRKSLDYNVDECLRLREEIINGAVGLEQQLMTRQAVNEKQVDATFESQTDVLMRLKASFEAAQKWTDETICRLRYQDSFISASISLGSRFFLTSLEELRDLKAKAIKAGAPESDLDALQRQITETEYRSNPLELQRMVILNELEPFVGIGRSEVAQLWKDGLVSDEDYLVKMNFASLIRRFERENANIIEFGLAIGFQRKIEAIREALRNYVAEDLAKARLNNTRTPKQQEQ